MKRSEIKADRKPGIYYAATDDGLELPVIDLSHPAFEIRLSEDELQVLLQQYLREVRGPAHMPAFLGQLLYALMRRRSVIMRGLMGAAGTYMSGLNTYFLKLGPKNLPAPYFNEIDRRIAGSPAGTYMRLRIQDMAQLLAGALLAPLEARPEAVLHLLNIGGGPAIDSLNALILVRKQRPELLAARQIFIHILDLDTAGPNFGARALAALRGPDAPLHGLQISFERTAYNWSRPADLRALLRSFGSGPSVMAASSEGALFEYGSDDDILGNLQVLAEEMPVDAAVVGSVTRADDLGLRANGARLGSRAALQFRGLRAFAALASRAGWTAADVIDRPLSHNLRLIKIAAPRWAVLTAQVGQAGRQTPPPSGGGWPSPVAGYTRGVFTVV